MSKEVSFCLFTPAVTPKNPKNQLQITEKSNEESDHLSEKSDPLMRVLRDLHTKDAKTNNMKRENANIDGDTAMGSMLKYGSKAPNVLMSFSSYPPLMPKRIAMAISISMTWIF